MLNEIEKSLVYDDGLLMYYAESNAFDQSDNFDKALKNVIALHAAIEGINESNLYNSIDIEKLQRETEKALKNYLYNESNLTSNEMLEHFEKAMNCIYYNNIARKNKGIELFKNFLGVYSNEKR